MTNHQKGLTSKEVDVIAGVMTMVWESGGTMTKREYTAYQKLCAYGRKLEK